VLERADLVSEVREVKHPFQKGIVSRVGVDY
jgi:ATP:corrinoid adenosyltransferase